jgi:hypothetical protein
MRSPAPTAAAVLAVLAVAACSKGEGGRGQAICTPFPENAKAYAPGGGASPLLPSDPAFVVDDCLHRWGYTLAAASDPAAAVAQATVAACTTSLTRWNQQTLSVAAGGPQPVNAPPQAPSLLTGQPTSPIAEHFAYAQSRALFYVVQARAGKCAPPGGPAAASGAR